MSAVAAWGQQYTINTFAGNQPLGSGYAGDSGAANQAQLNFPVAATVDSKGNLYICDTNNHRVRKVTPDGNITTVAGTGTASYSGDGGAATSATLNTPSGIAVDSAGNIYIADTKNFVIRKVTPDGKISTYAGNQGLGAGYGGDNGPPNSAGAEFDTPLGLALDPSGNLYIADAGSATSSTGNLIRKITTDGKLLTTVAGLGSTAGRIKNPTSLAVDASGTYLYIANVGAKNIVRLQLATGNLTNFAGNGSSGYSPDGPVGISTTLNNAAGVAIDAAGNVYIADTVNSLVRVVNPSGYMTTIAGHVLSGGRLIPGFSGDGGPATSAQLSSPKGLALDSKGNVYVCDSSNSVIRILQPTLPTIASGGIGNAFSYATQISPGAAAVIYGTGFGTATATSTTPLPTNAGGVTVTVNGVQAPLYYVSPGQVDFQVPWSTGTGTASVVVAVNGLASGAASVQAVTAGPGLHQVIQNYPDYSLNTTSNPVAAGGTVIAYATGSGPVSTQQTNGALPSGTVTVTSTCTATIGPSNAVVGFCGLQPNSVGLVQVNITVPSGLAGGTYPLVVTINGQASNAQNVSVK